MAQPAGWYQQPDGRSLYWNGTQWLAPSQSLVQEPSYVKRKNRIVPGVLMLLGALAVAAGSLLPWIVVSAGGISLPLHDTPLAIGLAPQLAMDGSPLTERDLLLGAGAIGLVTAILMLWTRRRGWGPVLRLVYALPWALSAALCAYWWWLSSRSLSDLFSPEDLVGQILRGLDELARGAGAYSIEPQAGLYVWSLGVALGFVGMLVPGMLYEVRIPRRDGH